MHRDVKVRPRDPAVAAHGIEASAADQIDTYVKYLVWLLARFGLEPGQYPSQDRAYDPEELARFDERRGRPNCIKDHLQAGAPADDLCDDFFTFLRQQVKAFVASKNIAWTDAAPLVWASFAFHAAKVLKVSPSVVHRDKLN